MATNRMVQVLVGIAALFATALAGIAEAPPAAACVGSCGDLTLNVENFRPEPPYVYGRPFSFYVRAHDVSYGCAFAAILCSPPTGEVDLLIDGFNPPVATDDLERSCIEGSTGNCENSHTGVFVTSAFPAGDREIVLVYRPGGPDAFDAEDKRVPIHISQASTILDLAAPTVATAGAPLTLTADVRPTSAVDLGHGARLPEGFVHFSDETVSPAVDLGSALIDNSGRATLTIPLLHDGSSSIVARYRGDGNYTGSSDTTNITAPKGTVAVALSESASATVYGEPFSVTATVTPLLPSKATPTGDVIFRTDVGTVQTVAMVSGGATATVSDLPVGGRVLDAVYEGSALYEGRKSSPIAHTVHKANTSVVVSSPTPDPSTLGQPVGLQATVLVTAPGAGTPTGTVQFRDGTTPLGAPVPLSGQVATLTTTALGGGNHSITATYSGDANLNGSMSNPLPRTVTCTTNITGNAGNVAVPATGTTCITNASVSGGVSIPAGAKVSIVNSTIAGYVTANGGAATILLCGTTVGGIMVSAATGAVTIGDPNNTCSANYVKGSIQVGSNRGGVTIGGNNVTGWIQCDANAPAPTNGGRPNTAAGRTGQCAVSGF